MPIACYPLSMLSLLNKTPRHTGFDEPPPIFILCRFAGGFLACGEDEWEWATGGGLLRGSAAGGGIFLKNRA